METTTLNLEKFSLIELEQAANDYHIYHKDNFFASEFDQSINDISRAKIKAMYKENGSCWLYKLNKWETTDPDVWEYKGQKVYNFSCSFITAQRDDLLAQMVIDYNQPKEVHNPKASWRQINEIFDRVKEVKGIITTWV